MTWSVQEALARSEAVAERSDRGSEYGWTANDDHPGPILSFPYAARRRNDNEWDVSHAGTGFVTVAFSYLVLRTISDRGGDLAKRVTDLLNVTESERIAQGTEDGVRWA